MWRFNLSPAHSGGSVWEVNRRLQVCLPQSSCKWNPILEWISRCRAWHWSCNKRASPELRGGRCGVTTSHPSSMLHLQSTQLPELSAHHLRERDLRKQAKFILRHKEALWSRRSKEQVRSLRERHTKSGGEQTSHSSVRELVIIKDESWNRNAWKLGVVRGAKLRARRGMLERPVQHLYPLELSVDRTRSQPSDQSKIRL